MAERIVISGIGVISPIGIGRQAYWQGLLGGQAGVKPISGVASLPEPYRYAGQVQDYRPEELLGSKGLKYLNQAAKFLLGAAELARRDARLEVNSVNTENIGVVVATGFSNVGDCARFYEGILGTGTTFNPLRFPNVFMNIPGGNLAIRLGIRGINATLANGATSSLDALQYGLTLLRGGRAEALLVGAVEVLSPPFLEGFWRAGLLGDTATPLPFARRRRGILLGEGCGVLVLEPAGTARKRGAPIYGEILGYGSVSVNEETDPALAKSIAEAMQLALQAAGMDVQAVDYLAAGANSSPTGDKAEAMAICQLFGNPTTRLPVSAIKSRLGELYSASGLFQVIACLLAAQHARIPATLHYEEDDPECPLPWHVRGESLVHQVQVALVNTFDSGRAASLVVRGK